jgi:hypothetical protein
MTAAPIKGTASAEARPSTPAEIVDAHLRRPSERLTTCAERCDTPVQGTVAFSRSRPRPPTGDRP